MPRGRLTSTQNPHESNQSDPIIIHIHSKYINECRVNQFHAERREKRSENDSNDSKMLGFIGKGEETEF